VKPLETVYWLRFALGILAAFICLGYAVGTNAISSTQFSSSTFFNSVALAIIVYILSYYYVKSKFSAKVQKTQKLVTAGIGIYFLAWIVFWALLYTLLAGSLPV
jgi:NhaP-type Na+/H+ and K+/H+ antiporter